MHKEKKINKQKTKNENVMALAAKWVRLAVMASVVMASPSWGAGPCPLHPGIPGPDEVAACTGNFSTAVPLVNTDLVLYYHSEPSLLDRYYASRGVSADYLGKHWRFINDASLFFNNQNVASATQATVVLGDGTALVYQKRPDNRFWPIDPRTTQSYIEWVDGIPARKMKDRTVQTFGFQDNSGVYHLTRLDDPNGKTPFSMGRSLFGRIDNITGHYGFNGASLSYLGNTTVNIQNKIGQNLSLTLAQGLLQKVQFPAQPNSTSVHHSFLYSGVGGRLSEHRYPSKDITATYFGNGALRRVIDHYGFSTSFTYTPNSVRVKNLGGTQEYTFSEGKLERSVNVESDERKSLARDPEGRILTQNSNGQVTTFTYGLSGGEYARTDLPTGVNLPGGVSLSITYAKRDESGGTWTLPTSVTTTGPGGSQTRQITYDHLNRVTTVTEGTATTAYSYLGNTDKPTRVTLNGQILFSASYDSNGHLTQMTDSKGIATTFSPGADGRFSSATNPYGGISSVTRDVLGRPKQFTHSGGSTRYHYDPQGKTQRVDSTNQAGYQQWAETIRYPK